MVDLCLRSIVAFLLTEGAWDNAQGWASLTADERNTTKAAYNDAGIALMVSAFGSSDTPTSSGTDPTDTANTMAAWVIQYGLDGIDVDYEVSLLRAYIYVCSAKTNTLGQDFNAFDSGTAEAWLITFTQALRAKLPASDYIITHARSYPHSSTVCQIDVAHIIQLSPPGFPPRCGLVVDT